MSVVIAQMPTTLYRHYARNGSLLYVGISCNESERRKAHRSDSVWFAQVHRIVLEEYPNRSLAEAAERIAIINERPAYNIVHAPREQRRAAEQRRRTAAGVPVLNISASLPSRAHTQRAANANDALPWAQVGIGDPCEACGQPSQWAAQRSRFKTERRRPWVALCTHHAVKEWVHVPDAEWFSRPRWVLYSHDMYVRPHDHLRYLVRLDGYQIERAWSFAMRASLGSPA